MDAERVDGSLAELSGWASPTELLRAARIMIVDDVPTNVELLERMLTGAGVREVLAVVDSRMVATHCQSWNPDLILLDLHMPHMDGIAVLNMLRATTPNSTFLPVLVLTADDTRQSKQAALAAGAKDFLAKPFERAEVLLRVQNLLSTRAMYLRLQRHNSMDVALALTKDRERIAMDLHDTVIQQLFGEALSLQSVVGLADERVAERIQSAISVLNQTVKQLRMTVFALQGPVGQPHGIRARLVTALTEATGELGFEPRLQFGGPIESLGVVTADDLLDVVGEALSNIASHADADAAVVDVEVGQDVVLTVTDNGTGIGDGTHHGRALAKMSDRARRLGGDCAITNQTSRGTSLTWRVPARSPSEHGADS